MIFNTNSGLGDANARSQAEMIRGMYNYWFEREPDWGGFMYWLGAYDPMTNHGEVAQAFINSPEAKKKPEIYGPIEVPDRPYIGLKGLAGPNEDIVAAVYRSEFNREPDTAGLAYWASVVGKGTSKSQLTDIFRASEEYKLLHATNGTDDSLPEEETLFDKYKVPIIIGGAGLLALTVLKK